MNAVQIVTIKNKIPLFKGEDQANSIELIELEENGFQLVSGKDLYSIGDKAIYIQPDYCLSDIPLFDSFIRPNGDPKKSMLGSNNRIRAKKFNFHTGNGLSIYSNGILLPITEVCNTIYPNSNKNDISYLMHLDLSENLGITKYEEPEEKNKGLKSGSTEANKPSDMYMTDEENINNVWKYINFPISLIGREKIDGSSISIFAKTHDNYGICSRKLQKRLFIKKVIGQRKKTLLETLMFWTKPNLNIYKEELSDSDFVNLGKPVLDKLISYVALNKTGIVLRGELCGEGSKGSGNKNNPHAKLPQQILFYGVDDYTNIAKKFGESNYLNITDKLGLNRPTLVFNKEFYSKEELLNECNNYFKNNMIEGIVVRNYDHTFSAKIMNPEYDSKK